MPRPRHPDAEPEILLLDDREKRRLANGAVGTGWAVPRVRRDGEFPIKD